MGGAGRPADQPIRFGTNGWRGIAGLDFTPPRARIAVAAIARWIEERGAGDVVLAHDTRAGGEELVADAAALLRGRGLRPIVAAGPLATPVAAHAVRTRRAAAGIVFTASHNPAEYQGLKVLGPWGGSIPRRHAERIEALARGAPAEPPRPRTAEPPVDLGLAYARELSGLLDAGVLAAAGLSVFYDAMHGAGAPFLGRALEPSGVRVVLLRGEPDPGFGGAPPDPSPERLAGLARRVRGGSGPRLGVATDGDADRFAVIDADGRALSETETLALLVDHAAETGRLSRGVALSCATGSLVERVARAHGLPVRRHPIGFSHLSAELTSGRADAAGDESGGFAWAGFAVDKDGILASCLLAERAARDGTPLRARIDELERRHGRSCCARRALPAEPAARAALERLRASPPERVAGAAVREADSADGLRLALDDGFLMLRASGTEPVLRLYAEAPDAADLEERLAAGARLLGSAP